MSVTTEEPLVVPVETPEFPDDLFHIPADDDNDFRAESGLPWRTLCGQLRPPSRHSHDWWEELPDDCAMCEHLLGDLL